MMSLVLRREGRIALPVDRRVALSRTSRYGRAWGCAGLGESPATHLAFWRETRQRWRKGLAWKPLWRQSLPPHPLLRGGRLALASRPLPAGCPRPSGSALERRRV